MKRDNLLHKNNLLFPFQKYQQLWSSWMLTVRKQIWILVFDEFLILCFGGIAMTARFLQFQWSVPTWEQRSCLSHSPLCTQCLTPCLIYKWHENGSVELICESKCTMSYPVLPLIQFICTHYTYIYELMVPQNFKELLKC